MNENFLSEWIRIVPPELYSLNEGKRIIKWKPTGARLEYGPRVVTGSKRRAADKYRGRNLTAVIDDETAIGFNMELYQNVLACLRIKGVANKFFLTASTPQVGRYAELIKMPGHQLFRGRTADNPFLDPSFEPDQRAAMSEEQARRELDAELVAHEGRIWKTFKYTRDLDDDSCSWPDGNRDDFHTGFDPSKPWWLFCDLGSSFGAYLVVQKRMADMFGTEVFPGVVWTAIADLCPLEDASAMRAFNRLDAEFGRPAGVVAGKDIDTRSDGDGTTVSYFVQNVWGNVPVYPAPEDMASKQFQYDCAQFMVCDSMQRRRLTIARDFVSLDLDSRRGLREMVDEDAHPPLDKRSPNEFLPKGRENTVQHIRDALLMGTEMIMRPPEWRPSNTRAF